MPSEKEQDVSTQTSEVSKFYHGKSLFITGAAGFVGLVMLEILLRCCPGIRRIYILLRPKKDVQPEERKELMFKKEIFYKVKEKDPDALNKVVVVTGDVSQENLGMCKDDLIKVTEEVTIVFHCAAAITFLKPLSFMMQQNVIGTQNIIELCRKLKNLDALVYTSTAYSNCNRTCIEEKVYEMPFTVDEVVELSKNDNEEGLQRLFKKCKPQFPNFYTFSKCVAENLILKRAADLPTSIVRPSVIICCMKGVLPGFIEYGSGLVSLSVGIGKGFIRVMRVDQDKRIDQIPVDVVANAHIVAACYQSSERLPSPFVINCTSGELAPVLWGEFIFSLMRMVLKYPLPNSYQRPGITLCKHSATYWFYSVLDHYIPAIVIDVLLWISGRKTRLLKLYHFYHKNMKATQHFLLREWEFQCENFKSLSRKLNTADTELFNVDLKDFNLEELKKALIVGAPMYRRKKDSKPKDDQFHVNYLRFYLTSLIKWSVLGGIASVFYMAVF